MKRTNEKRPTAILIKKADIRQKEAAAKEQKKLKKKESRRHKNSIRLEQSL